MSLVLPGIGAGHPALPFVIEDTEGRQLRIPRHPTRHANGATGTAGVSVSVRDLDAARPGFDTLFGPAIAAEAPLHEAERVARYAVGPHWLDVLERPDADEGMLSLALKRPVAGEITWIAPDREAIALV